jgi:hypothetical protein
VVSLLEVVFFKEERRGGGGKSRLLGGFIKGKGGVEEFLITFFVIERMEFVLVFGI